jgi:hypothetical protein
MVGKQEVILAPTIPTRCRIGDLAPSDPGEASLNFQSVGKVKLFPKGYSKRMLNTIALIKPL